MEVKAERGKETRPWPEVQFSRGMYSTIATLSPSFFFSVPPSRVVAAPSQLSLLLRFSFYLLRPFSLKSCPRFTPPLHSSAACLRSSTPHFTRPLTRAWPTPWSRCRAPTWGPWAGTPSLSVNSFCRGSHPSWGPTHASKAEAPGRTRVRRVRQLQLQGRVYRDEGARDPGKPREKVPPPGSMDRAPGEDPPPGPSRT